MFPETAQDVSKAVCFSRQNNIDLAVKGGGHTPDGGSSNDGGIVIDLGRMKRVSIDTSTKTVTAQGGALWVDVNNATTQSNLAVVSSTAGITGVGGLTLQGGYGFLTGAHGLIIDNLQSAKVVIASGQLLSASETENADLFWAIRGAGQNFGIAVELTFQAYIQPHNVFAGLLVFTADKLPTILYSLNSSVHIHDGKAAFQCVISQPPDVCDPLVTVVVFYNGPGIECRQRFVNLFSMDTVSADIRERPYEEANSLFDSVSPAGGRKRIIGFDFAVPLNVKFAYKLLNELKLKLQAEADLAQSYINLEFFDMSKVCQIPTTATAFPSRMTTQKGILVVQYTDSNKDDGYLRWARNIQQLCQAEFEQAGYEPNTLVSNFTYYTKRKFRQ